MELSEGLLRDECTVASIRKSLIPGVAILSLDCQKSKVELDLLKELLVVSEGGKTEYTLSREKPEYDEKKDFVAWGYVVGKKNIESTPPKQKLIVSLWGYIVMIESSENINNYFNVMDKVYFKLKHS
ncbi:MAG: DNA-directed RNA polymerase subunit G [Desulfurococcaceae archaeon TW002]